MSRWRCAVRVAACDCCWKKLKWETWTIALFILGTSGEDDTKETVTRVQFYKSFKGFHFFQRWGSKRNLIETFCFFQNGIWVYNFDIWINLLWWITKMSVSVVSLYRIWDWILIKWKGLEKAVVCLLPGGFEDHWPGIYAWERWSCLTYGVGWSEVETLWNWKGPAFHHLMKESYLSFPKLTARIRRHDSFFARRDNTFWDSKANSILQQAITASDTSLIKAFLSGGTITYLFILTASCLQKMILSLYSGNWALFQVKDINWKYDNSTQYIFLYFH